MKKCLRKQFEYPEICQFTKEYLQYSAGDIFYTAIAGTDILTFGNFGVVKERSQSKLKSYHEYREEYGSARRARQAYYAQNSFESTIQKGFSKESKTSKIINLYKNLRSFVELLNKRPELLQTAIPSFNDDDASIIYEEYNEIVDIMKDTEGVHLRNIKEKAKLAFVHGIKKIPAFTFQSNEEEETNEEIEIKNFKEDEEKVKEALNQIAGGGKNLFKKKDTSAWGNTSISTSSVSIDDTNKFKNKKTCIRVNNPNVLISSLTVLATNLPFNVPQSNIIPEFEIYGEITRYAIAKGRILIEFENTSSLNDALYDGNFYWEGRHINIKQMENQFN